jgi:hypothetical protein
MNEQWLNFRSHMVAQATRDSQQRELLPVFTAFPFNSSPYNYGSKTNDETNIGF